MLGFSPWGVRAKVGVCVFDNEKVPDLRQVLRNFVAGLPFLSHIEPTEFHGGSIYVNGGIKQFVTDNFLVIGDAAAQINPLGGEGVRHALWSGRFAANTIDQALKAGNSSKKALGGYEKLWKNYVGKKWFYSNLVKDWFYMLDDPGYDTFIRVLKGLTPQDAFSVMFEYEYRKLFRGRTLLALARRGLGKVFLRS